MIYTLTTNPAIDMNMCTNSIERKIVNRTHDVVYSPNGKGLNVSFVLKHFGVDSKVLGFFGGSRFVPIVTSFASIFVGAIFFLVWPPFQQLLVSTGGYI